MDGYFVSEDEQIFAVSEFNDINDVLVSQYLS